MNQRQRRAYILKQYAICIALALAGLVMLFFLPGCTSLPPDENGNFCATCIGPYDVRLRSHREALDD